MITRKRVLVAGRVQGVGFRPAVCRIAKALALSGIVYNDAKGVTIELQGEEGEITKFLGRLQSGDKPPLAQIKSCKVVDIDVVGGQDEFVIETSISEGTVSSEVTADVATCGDCFAELFDEKDFRYKYPFINCTNCGPRYSIIKNIPYDRFNTTMSVFRMCNKCAAQYTDASDRRFHAQPVACSCCGPKIWLTDNKGKILQRRSDDSIAEAAGLLVAGKIVAIKGLGGFHLAADAFNDEAVKRLRVRKKRDRKSFAMMADSVETIKRYAVVGKLAERALKSPQSPIVLLPKKGSSSIAESVAEGLDTWGFMLCYTPLHHLLFDQKIEVLVMTSGNISDEPLVCGNNQALERLGDVADVFLMHDREIYRQIDDSIVQIVGDELVVLRRARGYVPTPVFIKENCSEGIFAAGGDLKNTFCFGKQNQLICSEYVGDLENARVYHHYISSIGHFRKLFEVDPKIVACDLHPGYLSVQYARLMPGASVIAVQHHWAHVASVLAEHGVSGPVIGLVADGTGYGIDGVIWGCECLVASLDDFERFGHLTYFPLAGADMSGREAIRSVLGLLWRAYGSNFKLQEFKWLLARIEPDENRQETIFEQIEKQINCVETSSLGRVFDAVAAMLGLGTYNYFEAQLPMALEAAVSTGVPQRYDFEITGGVDCRLELSLSPMVHQMIDDIRNGVHVGEISAKFHNCLAAALLSLAERARALCNLGTVALSGGVFCNRYLINRVIGLLKKSGFNVLFNHLVPPNDGGISLGQAAIAAKLLLKK